MSKSILQNIFNCSLQNTARKNEKFSRNETDFKIGDHAKASPIQNPRFGSKLQIPKTILKYILQIIQSRSVQKKTLAKNTKYSRNETIFKIGHYAKAIAHAKSSLWLKNQNCKKHFKIHSTNHFQLFSAKNRSIKQKIFQK